MKKLVYLATLVAFLFSFNSCANEDPAQGVNIEQTFLNTATIEGIVYLSANKSDTEVSTYAPEGTVLSFSILNDDLGLKGSGVMTITAPDGSTIQIPVPAEGSYVKTVTVGADGNYTVTLPTRNDGTEVEVKITGAHISIPVKTADGEELQLFTIPSGTSIDVVSNMVYMKTLEYEYDETLTASATWPEGTYSVDMLYYNGSEEVNVPDGTEVKLTFDGADFVPARENDLIRVAKVEGGKLSFTMPAPSLALNPAGLGFTMESAFVGQVKDGVDADGNNIYVSKIFSLTNAAGDPQTGTIYGGTQVAVGKFVYKAGEEVSTPNNGWKLGNYEVKVMYRDFNGTNQELKSGTKVTVTIPGSSLVPASTNDLVKVFTVGAEGLLKFDLLAPSPVANASGLSFTLSASFTERIQTGTSPDGAAIMSDALFKIPAGTTGVVYGGINTKGSDIVIVPQALN